MSHPISNFMPFFSNLLTEKVDGHLCYSLLVFMGHNDNVFSMFLANSTPELLFLYLKEIEHKDIVFQLFIQNRDQPKYYVEYLLHFGSNHDVFQALIESDCPSQWARYLSLTTGFTACGLNNALIKVVVEYSNHKKMWRALTKYKVNKKLLLDIYQSIELDQPKWKDELKWKIMK